MNSENRKRKRVHPLIIDLSETDEKSRGLILKALAETVRNSRERE
jgi:hypothetical protein